MIRRICAALPFALALLAMPPEAGAKGPPVRSRTRTTARDETVQGLLLPRGTVVVETALDVPAPAWRFEKVASLGAEVPWCGVTFAARSALDWHADRGGVTATGTLGRAGNASGVPLAAGPVRLSCRDEKARALEGTLADVATIDGVPLPRGGGFFLADQDGVGVYARLASEEAFLVRGVWATSAERIGGVERAVTLARDGAIDGVTCKPGKADFHPNGVLERCEGAEATFEGARVSVTWRAADGSMKSGKLLARATLRGVRLPAGTEVGVDERDVLDAHLPNRTDEIAVHGYPCVGRVQMYRSGAFGACDFGRPFRVGRMLTTGVGRYPSGAISGVDLVRETWVRGLPAMGSLGLYESGAVRSVQLARAFVVHGTLYPARQVVDLYEDGRVQYVWR